ncbi:hypothetical protein ACP275_09G112200 [Erythranthe tilingii]
MERAATWPSPAASWPSLAAPPVRYPSVESGAGEKGTAAAHFQHGGYSGELISHIVDYGGRETATKNKAVEEFVLHSLSFRMINPPAIQFSTVQGCELSDATDLSAGKNKTSFDIQSLRGLAVINTKATNGFPTLAGGAALYLLSFTGKDSVSAYYIPDRLPQHLCGIGNQFQQQGSSLIGNVVLFMLGASTICSTNRRRPRKQQNYRRSDSEDEDSKEIDYGESTSGSNSTSDDGEDSDEDDRKKKRIKLARGHELDKAIEDDEDEPLASTVRGRLQQSMDRIARGKPKIPRPAAAYKKNPKRKPKPMPNRKKDTKEPENDHPKDGHSSTAKQ